MNSLRLLCLCIMRTRPVLVEVGRDKVRCFTIPRESLLIDSMWEIYKLKQRQNVDWLVK